MSRGESAAVKRLIKSILGAPTHYEVLGVDEDASAEDIGREYRDLARTVHPDKGGDAAAFKKLANAKDVLLDQNSRMAYDLELREAREPAPAPKKPTKKPAAKPKKEPAAKEPKPKKEPARKPKKEPKAKKPAAKRAAPASPPEDASPPEAPPKRGRASPPEQAPPKRGRAAAPAPESDDEAPKRAPMPYRGSCTCPILAIESFPPTAAARLVRCPAGDSDRHACSCYQLRQTFQGTVACRVRGGHACVCATKAAGRFVAGKSTAACRADAHDCSCLFDGHPLCKAKKHACSCRHSGIATCRALKHDCACVATRNPAACLATKHDCACDALAGCFFAGPKSCRATKGHACVCAKAGPKACRADEVKHACICKDLEKTSGGLFSGPSTASCMARKHDCLCPLAHNGNGAFKTNDLCRAPGQTWRETLEQTVANAGARRTITYY